MRQHQHTAKTFSHVLNWSVRLCIFTQLWTRVLCSSTFSAFFYRLKKFCISKSNWKIAKIVLFNIKINSSQLFCWRHSHNSSESILNSLYQEISPSHRPRYRHRHYINLSQIAFGELKFRNRFPFEIRNNWNSLNSMDVFGFHFSIFSCPIHHAYSTFQATSFDYKHLLRLFGADFRLFGYPELIEYRYHIQTYEARCGC